MQLLGTKGTIKCVGPCNQVKNIDEFPNVRDKAKTWKQRRRCNTCTERSAAFTTRALTNKVLRERYNLGIQSFLALSARCYKYGITAGDFLELLEEQEGKCKLCGDNKGMELFIDHCSITMKVRGLLCCRCNSAIGQLLHDPVLIRKAAQYIEEAAP